MLKELAEYLGKQAVEAAGAKVIKPPAEPAHVYLLQNQDGTVGRYEAAPAPRDHKAQDLATVAEFAKSNEGSAVWYSREAVVALVDDTARRDRVTMKLHLTPQVKLLAGLESSPRFFAQKDFVFLLRTTFAKCLGRAGNLLAIVRVVKFNAVTGGEAVVQHGKSSVGRTIQQEITGAAALPEYVTLDVPVFTSPELGRSFPVECALEPDPVNNAFQLLPLPGEVERAVCAAEAAVADALAEHLAGAAEGSEVPVRYGQP